MTNKFTAALVSVLALASIPAVAAQVSYEISFIGAGVSGDVIVNTNGVANPDGSYTITGVSGQRNGSPLTGLLPAGFNPTGPYPGLVWVLVSDNEFFPNFPDGPFLDGLGFSFMIDGGYGPYDGPHPGDDVNLYYANGSYYDLSETDMVAACPTGTASCNFAGTSVTVSVQQVPEPATLGLVGLALACVGFARRPVRA